MTSPFQILTVGEMYAADRAAAEGGIQSFSLMQRAGEAVAREVMRRWSKRPVTVLCGPGLNGGDGYVAARVLAGEGWDVRVLALGEPGEGDAARARGEWTGPAEPLSASPAPSCEGGIVIDALFGAGLSRPLPAEAEAALGAAETAGLPIVAVDLPSGLPGDAPQPPGYAPRATVTVTFHRKKPAHVLEPAAETCGEVVVADIGIPDAATPQAALWENDPGLWLDRFPWPRRNAHKHSRGRLGVVGGKRFDTGRRGWPRAPA